MIRRGHARDIEVLATFSARQERAFARKTEVSMPAAWPPLLEPHHGMLRESKGYGR